MRYTRNKNRLSHFFLLFLPYYLEHVDLFCIFVPTVEPNSPHNPSPHSPNPSPHSPPPHLTASPRPSPVGRETKHMKSAETSKLSHQNSALKIQPSKFNLQNSTFKIQPSKFNLPKAPHLSTLISHLYISIINYQLSTIRPPLPKYY